MRAGPMVRYAVHELVTQPPNLERALGILGGGTKAKSELATRIANISGKRRDSVLRTLERHTTEAGQKRGRAKGLNAEYRQLIRDALMPELVAKVVDRMLRVGIVIDLEAEVTVSADARVRDVDDTYVTGPALRATTFGPDAKAGRWASAADELAAAWGDAYMRAATSWDDVDYLRLRWPRGRS